MNTKMLTIKSLEQLHQQIRQWPDCRLRRGIRHRYHTVTLRRVLQASDADALDSFLGQWLLAQANPK